VICDACQSTISGIRHKCSVCEAFDLCDTCRGKDGVHEPSHIFVKILKPTPSFGRGCPYMRPGVNRPKFQKGYQPNYGTNSTRLLARFVSDVTLFDGTIVPSNQGFVKIWRLRNEGATAWPEDTHLVFVGGDRLSVVESVDVPPVAPGAEFDVSVDMVAPSKPGRYVSYWRLSTGDGSRFGQRIWVNIVVPQPEQTTQSDSTTIPIVTPSIQQMEVESPVVVPLTLIPNPAPVPTPTTPTPVLVPVTTPIYSPKVQQLLDMGFSDPQLIQVLLEKHGGDVVSTVQALVTYNQN